MTVDSVRSFYFHGFGKILVEIVVRDELISIIVW